MKRPYKFYRIIEGAPIYFPALEKEINMINLLYDQDSKEYFPPSELPIWDGTNISGCKALNLMALCSGKKISFT